MVLSQFIILLPYSISILNTPIGHHRNLIYPLGNAFWKTLQYTLTILNWMRLNRDLMIITSCNVSQRKAETQEIKMLFNSQEKSEDNTKNKNKTKPGSSDSWLRILFLYYRTSSFTFKLFYKFHKETSHLFFFYPKKNASFMFCVIWGQNYFRCLKSLL